ARNHGIQLAMDRPESHWYVTADRQRLKQVLVNLLANAIKYNREAGTVHVMCEQVDEARLRISVTDTGPGIAPEHMERLFTPFDRLGAGETGIEGTGIGLALSKKLVELMGGRIQARSEVGRGSTFSVEFERAEATELEESSVTATAAPATGADTPARTILYVEDNLPNLKLVERILARRPPTRLLAAMQGGLGLELAAEHRPDLILLDVHLPDMTGDDVLRGLKESSQTRAIPVVMISAEASKGKIERFLAAGASAYLTKPLDVAEFLRVIDDALNAA
ncbi:MAG: ATP-binding response regulator, partial [Gammaproteobacteria bacterium]